MSLGFITFAHTQNPKSEYPKRKKQTNRYEEKFSNYFGRSRPMRLQQ
jgi:hypothetical protein